MDWQDRDEVAAYVLFSGLYDELTIIEAAREVELINQGFRGPRGPRGPGPCPVGAPSPSGRAEFPENFE